jgi:hypothetical protein
LEQTTDLTSLVGFRVLTSSGRTDRAGVASEALATERWLDEGGTGEPMR